MRGTPGNPSTVVASLTTASFLNIRFWDGKKGDEFKYVGIYDPETHASVHRNLAKGESAAFEWVIRIPARFEPNRAGFHSRYPAKMAWYNFTPSLGKMTSTFSPDGIALVDSARAEKGQMFDFDIYQMKVLGASEPVAVGGMAKGGSRSGWCRSRSPMRCSCRRGGGGSM